MSFLPSTVLWYAPLLLVMVSARPWRAAVLAARGRGGSAAESLPPSSTPSARGFFSLCV